MDHMNYYEPYNSLEAHHENQLTRAFLVLLRLSPQVQGAFLDLVRKRQLEAGTAELIPALSEIARETAVVRTQTARPSQSTGRLVSIFMSDDHLKESAEVGDTDRRALLDGVIEYNPDWILVIENKPRVGDYREDQLSVPLDDDTDVEREEIPVDLLWSDMVTRITSLLERGLLGYTETLLAEDFLKFVSTHFEFLNPYTTLGVCRRSRVLVVKRCGDILEELLPGTVREQRAADAILPSGTARLISLALEDGWLRLGLWPGDLVSQARSFGTNVRRAEFFKLLEKGWTVSPNLHFSYRGSHRVYGQGEMDLEQYFDYWYASGREIRRFQREESLELFDQLEADRAIGKAERSALEREFTMTKRSFVDLCPGMEVLWRWPIQEAEELDRQGRLVNLVQERVFEAMSTWNQVFPPRGD